MTILWIQAYCKVIDQQSCSYLRAWKRKVLRLQIQYGVDYVQVYSIIHGLAPRLVHAQQLHGAKKWLVDPGLSLRCGQKLKGQVSVIEGKRP